MKSKRFIDYRLGAGIVPVIIFCGAAIGILFVYSLYIKSFIIQNIPPSMLVIATLVVLTLLIGILWCIRYFSRRTMPWLSIKESEIVWRCPLYRTVRLKAEDCLYAKIVDMNDHQIAMPVIRGDELSYIYLSNVPYPKKYQHKADEIKCKKGTIIFAYSDKLCKALIDILPQQDVAQLVAFYNRMQANDKIAQLQEKKRKNKRKK